MMRVISHRDSDYGKILAQLKRRATPQPDIEQSVRSIIDRVAREGDRALCAFSLQFEGWKHQPGETPLPPSQLENAINALDDKIVSAIATSHANVSRFARESLRQSWEMKNAQGARVGELYRPYQRVGIYVPGGSAPLISTVLMTVTLAQVAGVPEIVVTTPPNAEGEVNAALLYALQLAGATEIHRLGGAQAIAALALGTETIAPVEKIAGPGNSYVVEAKRQLYGTVNIDLLPGPSEILVLADDSGRAPCIAADMLAQAEHGTTSEAILVSPDESLCLEVAEEIESQKQSLSRLSIVEQSLQNGVQLLHTTNWEEAIAIANDYAPEHLSLLCHHPDSAIEKIHHAGAIFIGNDSPVAAGDFVAGPSHTLPTGGAAKSFAGLTVDQFQKRTSIIHYDQKALAKSRDAIETFAATEGLDAHQNSIAIRFS